MHRSRQHPESTVRGGDGLLEMHQGSPNATRSFNTHSRFVSFGEETIFSLCAETALAIGQGTMVFQKIFKRNQTDILRCTVFCCTYEQLVIHGPNMMISLSHGGTWLARIDFVAIVFCLDIPSTVDQCLWTCGDTQIYISSRSKIIADDVLYIQEVVFFQMV